MIMKLIFLIIISLASNAFAIESTKKYHCETELIAQPFIDIKSNENPNGTNKMKVYVHSNQFMKFEFDNQYSNLKIKYKSGKKMTERTFLCVPTIDSRMLTCNGVIEEYKTSQLVNWSRTHNKFSYFSTSPMGLIANGGDAEVIYYGKCNLLQ